MKLPKLIKFLLWKLFINENPLGKVEIINYIKYDAELNADMFLVFIAGEKGYLMLDCVDHTDESVAILKDALENKIKVFYNLGGVDYKITTIMHGEEPDGFMELKKLALQNPTICDRFKSSISGVCYG